MTRYEADLAIRNRYAAYCFAADDRDPEAMADCFTVDAVVYVDGELKLNGRDAIAQVQRKPSTNRHLVLNPWVRALGDQEATVAAYFLVLDAEAAPIGHGRYSDELIRDSDGAWRWRERHIDYVWRHPSYAAFVATVTNPDDAS